MKTTEELFNELPLRITKTLKQNCWYCNQPHKVQFTYELKIITKGLEIVQGKYERRYWVFYETTHNLSGNSNDYIGSYTGTGFRTFKEAIEDLKTYLKGEKHDKEK